MTKFEIDEIETDVDPTAPTDEEAKAEADRIEAEEKRKLSWLLVAEQRTENALAQRFIDLHGEDLRYVPLWRKWLVWDGKRFKIDNDSAAVLRLARKFAAKLWDDFAKLAKRDQSLDEKTIKVVTSFCKETNKEKNIGAFIKLARADSRVCVNVDDINANPSLLNLRNGTIDLNSAAFRKHDRGDLLTQMAEVSYDAKADCPTWKETLSLIFDGDAELIRYVQQVLGYSLSGDVGEHILPIAYGHGCNGKSTVWNCVLELAGDYGAVANDSLLLGENSAHPTEKAALYQKRIVAISEPEQGSRMRESRVKELTGDSLITARRMREDFWTFRRTHTFWLSTNHLPRVNGTDEGIWRRIKLIPFEVDLRDKVEPIADFHLQLVEQEGAGILNWLLEGLRDYYQRGSFSEPETVRRWNQRYRGDQDHIGCFVADCCVVGECYMAPASRLFEAYKEWGGHWTKTAFGRALGERFEKEKPTAGDFRRQVIYHGIAVENDG